MIDRYGVLWNDAARALMHIASACILTVRDHNNKDKKMFYRLPILAVFLLSSGCGSDMDAAPGGKSVTTTGVSTTLTLATLSDYATATGCEPGESYDYAMQSALDYALFRDIIDDNLFDTAEYARRHSRDFFTPLLDGSMGDDCLTPGLHRLAVELEYELELEKIPDADTEEIAGAISLQTRGEYMAATECLASPTTWAKYRTGLYATLFGLDDSGSDIPHLKQFLQELGEGRRTEDNFLDPACLNDSMTKIAAMAGLLDDEGRFALE